MSVGLYGLPARSGKLKDLSKFDAMFFGIHAKQAHTMDPQLRLLMEVAYEAIVDGGGSQGGRWSTRGYSMTTAFFPSEGASIQSRAEHSGSRRRGWPHPWSGLPGLRLCRCGPLGKSGFTTGAGCLGRALTPQFSYSHRRADFGVMANSGNAGNGVQSLGLLPRLCLAQRWLSLVSGHRLVLAGATHP